MALTGGERATNLSSEGAPVSAVSQPRTDPLLLRVTGRLRHSSFPSASSRDASFLSSLAGAGGRAPLIGAGVVSGCVAVALSLPRPTLRFSTVRGGGDGRGCPLRLSGALFVRSMMLWCVCASNGFLRDTNSVYGVAGHVCAWCVWCVLACALACMCRATLPHERESLGLAPLAKHHPAALPSRHKTPSAAPSVRCPLYPLPSHWH